MLLLDEPFANLDAELRQRMREELRRLLRELGATVVLVTHDRDEALSLADRVAVMLGGTIVQVDTPERVYHEPKTREVARLLGQATFVPARVLGTIGRSDLGPFALEGERAPVEQVELLLRPRDVVLEPHPEGLGVVVDRRFVGAETVYRVLLRCGITVETSQPPSVELAVGERVEVRCNRARLAAFAGSERIGLAALLSAFAKRPMKQPNVMVVARMPLCHREQAEGAGAVTGELGDRMRGPSSSRVVLDQENPGDGIHHSWNTHKCAYA